MKKLSVTGCQYSLLRKMLFVFGLTFSSMLLAAPDAPKLPVGACPLNSGGESLLGTEWRLLSIYGNRVPQELEINLKIGESTLSGFAGCNSYTSLFRRVGHTGFMITSSAKNRQACSVMRTTPGGPTINVGDWEGSYIRTLQRAGSVQQVGNTLHFYNRNGEPSVVFTKKYGKV